jgi:alpha-tubulin suppressor-like RCC1 family protein
LRRAETARAVGALALLTALGIGCLGPGDFICHTNDQCGGGAFCESNDRCSTFDDTCASHRRYLAAAGDDSDACVTSSCSANPITALSAGGSATCALRQGGGVTCWGRNDDGQLGDGTLTPRSTGVSVLGLDDAAAIAAGARHACAVRGTPGSVPTSGPVVCWGADDTGQLGDGGGVDQLAPVAVPGISNATAVVAGAGFSCALLADRSVVCWGDDSDGEIGDGAPATTPRGPTPVAGLTNVRALAAHWQHACALLTDGTVACWGSNTSGQLGDGTTIGRAQPVAVPGLGKVAAIATGLSHTCAMTAGGVHCWGSNSQGQMGNGTSDATTPVLQPTLVQIVIDPVAIDAGAQHTCIARLGGQVLCWGGNTSGQLGEGTMTSITEPVPVIGVGNARAVATGATFSCASTSDGAVFCWGDDHYGQLGDGRAVVRPAPGAVAGNLDAVTAGGAHTCAISRGATADADAFVCWGSDQAGQLGDNDDVDRGVTAPIKVDIAPTAISAGGLHTCATDTTGNLWCWGRGSSGQLGPGHPIDTPLPIEVALPAGAGSAVAAATGDAHTCVLVSPDGAPGGDIYCFGDNTYGQLGDGTLNSRATLAPVTLGPSAMRAAMVSAGSDHSCALDVTGQIWCWGRGDSGQLGDGAPADQPAPLPVVLPGGLAAAALSAGGAHSCAVDVAGGVWCWGADDRGQLGLGATGGPVTAPAAVAGLTGPAKGVSAGGAHTCADLAGDNVWCWGANDSGQLGDGTTVDRPTPARVAGAAGTVSAGAMHTCASATGHTSCWGADTSGQLGDGATLTISAPELARIPCD